MLRFPGKRSLWIAAPCVALFLVALRPASATDQPPDFEKKVKPQLQTFCASCHDTKTPPGGINPIQYRSTAEVQKANKEFERIIKALQSGAMPPTSAKQPTAKERADLIADLQSILSGDCKLPDPGRVTIRRLNRVEYANTIKDLTGVAFQRTDDFPSDDVGFGFDNIGDVLTVSPLLMEKYLFAAEQIAEQAIVVANNKPRRFEGDELLAKEGRSMNSEGESVLFTAATLYVENNFTSGGTYRIKVRAYGQQAGPEPCRMAIGVDGVQQPAINVPQTVLKPEVFEVPISVTPGKHRIEVSFLNDFYNPTDPDPKNRDRNLVITSLEIQGAAGAALDYAQLPESHRRIIPAPAAPGKELETGRQDVAAFAAKAFRRPPTSEELDRLMTVFKAGQKNKETFERCVQLAVTAALTSPNFLFRVEPETRPGRELNSYEIASRLSYFLWSSMPDQTLFDLAAADKLKSPTVLDEQVDRMLADPRSDSLVTNFGAQWMQLPKFMNTNPDRKLFLNFNNQIKNLMRQEALQTFRYVLRQDRPVTEFLNGNYAFLNDQLSYYYGIPDVKGAEFRKVDVDPNQKGGVFTLGAVLTLTSNPTRTSPTKRGRWILEQILGTPPPPPPPGADQLKGTAAGDAPRTFREQLEAHRSNPDCASCHSRLDPLGFSLENFDGAGVFRYRDGNLPVDPTGELPDGTKIKGLAELKTVLFSKKGQFVRALSEKMLTYALGRGMRLSDNCALDQVSAAAEKNEYTMKSMIHSIVQTDAFRKQGT